MALSAAAASDSRRHQGCICWPGSNTGGSAIPARVAHWPAIVVVQVIGVPQQRRLPAEPLKRFEHRLPAHKCDPDGDPGSGAATRSPQADARSSKLTQIRQQIVPGRRAIDIARQGQTGSTGETTGCRPNPLPASLSAWRAMPAWPPVAGRNSPTARNALAGTPAQRGTAMLSQARNRPLSRAASTLSRPIC